MVVLQAVISVLILVSAGLAVLGFRHLSRDDLGIATNHRVVFRVQFPEPAYDTHEKRARLLRDLDRNLAREPALTGFGFSTTIPVGDFQWGGRFQPQLASGEFAPDPAIFQFRRVSPGTSAPWPFRCWRAANSTTATAPPVRPWR
jgi:hypothetical protein